MDDGILVEKADVLGDEPMEDKVYVKKLIIATPLTDNHRIEFVSVSSNNKDFKDVNPNDMRINIFGKTFNTWTNVFITEASDTMIDIITNKLFKK